MQTFIAFNVIGTCTAFSLPAKANWTEARISKAALWFGAVDHEHEMISEQERDHKSTKSSPRCKNDDEKEHDLPSPKRIIFHL